jgi:hypothetical protein
MDNLTERFVGHVDWRLVPGAKVETDDWAFGRLEGTVCRLMADGNVEMAVENWEGLGWYRAKPQKYRGRRDT